MLRRLSARARDRVILALQLGALVLAFFATPLLNYVLEADSITAEASAAYSEDLEAAMAIDGNPDTEWCLPDGTLGYIDLTFSHRRRVDAVVITNGHNRTYMDRAIRRARLSLYDDERVIEQHDVEFPGIEPQHKQRRIALQGKRATRLRLEVTEFAGTGAALAELRVE